VAKPSKTVMIILDIDSTRREIIKKITVFAIVLGILLTTISPLSFAASATTSAVETISYLTPYQQTWIDEFNNPTLDTRWEWVREDNSLWSLTANPGNMQNHIQRGTIYNSQ
jgi:hypothetical protein